MVKEIKNIGEQSIYISSVTAAELYFGALNKEELDKIRKRINRIIHIPINESITEIFENLMIKYSLIHKIGIPDAIIAATAIHYSIPLYTLNKKDFYFIPDIILY
ncbi:MAG: type II toxin-antitoxin system VapC family toxin [Bacteroidales bacterium]|nr:type II toxin-antitoxin system VapC family toxin [Bacteroidales bacterium]